MRPAARFLMIGCILLAFSSGCAYQSTIVLPPVGYPESIFAYPVQNNLAGARALVFRFIEPYYAPGVGKSAAQCVIHAMQSTATVGDLTVDLDSIGLSIGRMNFLALENGCSRFVTGRVNSYFEGSDFESTVVAQEIWVYRTALPHPELLWHAASREAVAPKPLTDYIFVNSMGAPAFSTLILLKRNAEKFNNMLRDLPMPEANQVASTQAGTAVSREPAYSGYK
jgi:hypothetical protein